MKNTTVIFISLFTLLVVCLAFVSPAYAGTGPTLPPRIIPVTGNGLMTVVNGMPNQFNMKDGDEVLVPSMDMRDLKISITTEKHKTMPSALPENVHFIDALTVNLVQNSSVVEKLPNKVELLVSFARDAMLFDMEETVAILHWNGQKWIEASCNLLETKTSLPGLYVLVSR
ncbi:MAG: hypothetical protein WCI88_12240 [Chloroflexota bacterium]